MMDFKRVIMMTFVGIGVAAIGLILLSVDGINNSTSFSIPADDEASIDAEEDFMDYNKQYTMRATANQTQKVDRKNHTVISELKNTLQTGVVRPETNESHLESDRPEGHINRVRNPQKPHKKRKNHKEFKAKTKRKLRTGPEIYAWSKAKFHRTWIFNHLQSCVDYCSPRRLLVFNLTGSMHCSKKLKCSYEKVPSHEGRLAKSKIVKSPICKSNHEALCPRTLASGCNSYTWVIRRVTLGDSASMVRKFTLDITLREGHPFRIHSIMESGAPGYLLVISFYLPNILFRDRCNQLYCIFFDDPKNLYEVKPAIVGDASFTYCQYPAFPISNQTRLQLAYRPEIMSSTYPVVIESPVTNIPYVNMTICVMVRGEAENMVEWIEFHRMMGYQRFIVYDNNPYDDPDYFMEKLLTVYPPGVILRRHWKLLHSQTEAYTDCINRYGRTTHWMTLIDVDEFIVPHPSYPSVRYVLENLVSKHSNIHVTWLTFGPCGDVKRLEGELMMDLCNSTTRPSSDYPKSIFKANMAAGMQNYGPHYIRMKKDLGRRIMSRNSATKYLQNYHYRYRTYPEFIERRQGPRAGRALTLTVQDLKKEWKEGIKYSKGLAKQQNWILRFRDELGNRTRGIFEVIHRMKKKKVH